MGIRKVLVIAVIAVVALVAVVTVSTPHKAVPASRSAPAVAPTPLALEYRYPRDRVDGFMATCNADGQHGPGCTCLIDKVQETFTLAQFMQPTADDPVGKAMVAWGPECSRAR